MATLDQDLPLLQRWWSAIAPSVPSQTAALWFGITDLVVDGHIQRTLYVAGCDRFDPADSTGDWAAAPYSWWPNNRYVSLPGLAALPNDNYRAVLDHAVALVQALVPRNTVDVQAVAVGFDDGDFTVIWSRV